MTQRRVIATPRDTYFQPTGIHGQVIEQNQKQRRNAVMGALGQLNKNIQNAQAYEREEEAEQIRAESSNQARQLAADYMPIIEQDLAKPETYNMSADEFLQSDSVKKASDQINAIQSEKYRKQYQDQFKALVLDRFAKGKAREEANERNHQAALAQKAGAQLGGIKEQIAAYEDGLRSGVSDDELFTSGLALSIMNGSEYLNQYANARDWTPEQMLQIERAKASLSKNNNAKAKLDMKRAASRQSRIDKFNAYAGIREEHWNDLSDDQQATVQVNLENLQAEILTEQTVSTLLGDVSKKDLALGVGLGNKRKIPLADITKIQNDEAYAAIQSGDMARLIQLTSIPGDEPRAIKDTFSQIIGAVETVDPNNPSSIEALLYTGHRIEEALGKERIRYLLSERDYVTYTQLKGIAEFEGIPSAITRVQELKRLEANGKLPQPEDWNPREIVNSVIDELDGWGFWKNDIERPNVNSLLMPYMNYWKAKGLNQGEIQSHAEEIVRQSSWKGMLNGKLLGEYMHSLTNVDGGNPYEHDAGDMFDEYIKFKLEEFKELQPALEEVNVHVSPLHASVLVFTDAGDTGIPLVNGVVELDDIKRFVETNVSKRKDIIKKEGIIEQERNRQRETDLSRGIFTPESIYVPPEA